MTGRRGYRSQGEDASIDSRGSTGHRRARIQKACDMCHEMKTKCDGAMPCTHCKQSFLDCVYSESRPKRRRISSQPRKEQLQRPRTMADDETRLHHAAARNSMGYAPELARTSDGVVWMNEDPKAPATDSTPTSKATCGEARFISSSADRAFIERLRIELGEWPGSDIESRLTVLKPPTPRFFSWNRAPRSAVPLPSLPRARQLINIALDANILYQVVHKDRFERTFQLLFLLEERNYGEEEIRHLPLVYVLLALGVIFEKQSDSSIDTKDERLMEGMAYFDTCRDLINLEDSSLLTTLQAIFYMNLFLLATSSLNSCYTSLVHVQTLVMRMSLHPSSCKNKDLIDTELEARLFWSIRQLLVVVSASTGLPSPISAASFHINLPAGLQDTSPSRQSESGAHLLRSSLLLDVYGFLPFISLHNILDRVIQKMYPPTAVKTTQGSSSSHYVSLETVMDFENQLKHWSDNLPEGCKHNQGVARSERANYELLMTYCHVQIYLYRPFLHYMNESLVKIPGSSLREGFQKFASTCIEASRNIIYMGEDMNRNGLLFGAEWRIAHMILTAALSLLYIPLSDSSSTLAAFVMTDLMIAKSLLSVLRPYCVRAQRAHLVLTVLTAAVSGPCEEPFPTSQNQHGMWDSRHPLPEGPDSAYTVALKRRLLQSPLVLEQNHSSYSATDTSPRLHFSSAKLAQDGLPLRSSSQNELNPLTETCYYHSVEEGTHSPTRTAPQVEIQIPPLQSPAAILDKLGLNPEIAFNDPTAYYCEARPSSIFKDIAFDDEPFYQLFGDGAAASMQGASEDFVSRYGSFS